MARTLPNKLRVAGAFGFLLVAVAIATASPGEPVDAIVPEMMEDDPTLIELEGEELEFLESPLTATTYARGKASRLAFDQGKFATLLQKVRSGTSAFILTGLRESGGDHMHVTASEPFKNTKMVTQRNGSEHSATPPQVVVMVGHMQDQPTDSTVSIACESNGCHGILQQIIDGQVHTETIDTRPVSADKPDGDALITLHPPSETQLPQVAEDFWDINDDPIEDLTQSVLQNILNAPGPSPAQFGNTTASELNLIGKDSSSAKEVFGGSATNNLGYLHQGESNVFTNGFSRTEPFDGTLKIAVDCSKSCAQKRVDMPRYLAGLLAAMKSIMEHDMGFKLEITFIRLWHENPGDMTVDLPNGGGTTTCNMDSDNKGKATCGFATYWDRHMKGHVEYDAVMALTGHHYGGMAGIGGICFGAHAHGGLMGGDNSLTASSQSALNWDMYILLHELGHVMGSPHTHSYLGDNFPGWPMDTCAVDKSSRAAGYTRQCSIGTIMSYCGGCGGQQSYEMRFHPNAIKMIKATTHARCSFFNEDIEDIKREATASSYVGVNSVGSLPDREGQQKVKAIVSRNALKPKVGRSAGGAATGALLAAKLMACHRDADCARAERNMHLKQRCLNQLDTCDTIVDTHVGACSSECGDCWSISDKPHFIAGTPMQALCADVQIRDFNPELAGTEPCINRKYTTKHCFKACHSGAAHAIDNECALVNDRTLEEVENAYAAATAAIESSAEGQHAEHVAEKSAEAEHELTQKAEETKIRNHKAEMFAEKNTAIGSIINPSEGGANPVFRVPFLEGTGSDIKLHDIDAACTAVGLKPVCSKIDRPQGISRLHAVNCWSPLLQMKFEAGRSHHESHTWGDEAEADGDPYMGLPWGTAELCRANEAQKAIRGMQPGSTNKMCFRAFGVTPGQGNQESVQCYDGVESTKACVKSISQPEATLCTTQRDQTTTRATAVAKVTAVRKMEQHLKLKSWLDFEKSHSAIATVRGRKLYKAQVSGVMHHANMLAACAEEGLLPVCDANNKGDAGCAVITSFANGKHLSYPPDSGSTEIKPASATEGVCFYVAPWMANVDGPGSYNAMCRNGANSNAYNTPSHADSYVMCTPSDETLAEVEALKLGASTEDVTEVDSSIGSEEVAAAIAASNHASDEYETASTDVDQAQSSSDGSEEANAVAQDELTERQEEAKTATAQEAAAKANCKAAQEAEVEAKAGVTASNQTATDASAAAAHAKTLLLASKKRMEAKKQATQEAKVAQMEAIAAEAANKAKEFVTKEIEKAEKKAAEEEKAEKAEAAAKEAVQKAEDEKHEKRAEKAEKEAAKKEAKEKAAEKAAKAEEEKAEKEEVEKQAKADKIEKEEKAQKKAEEEAKEKEVKEQQKQEQEKAAAEATAQEQPAAEAGAGDSTIPKSDTTFTDADGGEHPFFRVQISGKMNHANIKAACSAKGLLPVCNGNMKDNGCRYLTGGTLSSPGDAIKAGLSLDALDRACFYTKFWAAGYEALCFEKSSNAHHWSPPWSKDGVTICTTPPPPPAPVFYKDRDLVPAFVEGAINHASLKAACSSMGMKPVCDASHMTHSACWSTGVQKHLSSPSSCPTMGMPKSACEQKCFFAQFWATKVGAYEALCNNGGGHYWANANTKNKWTLCAPPPPPPAAFTYTNNGVIHTIVPTKVHGEMNNSNMIAACEKTGLKPVCDASHLADGSCIDLTGSKRSWTWPPHTKAFGVDPLTSMKNIYVYAGWAGNRGNPARQCCSLQNLGNNNRWSNPGEKDGFTICA